MLYGFIYEQFPVQNVFVKPKYKSTRVCLSPSLFIIAVPVLCPSTQTLFFKYFYKNNNA